MEKYKEYFDPLIEAAMKYGVSLVTALLVLVVGWWIVSKILNVLDVSMARSRVERTLQRFLHSLLSIILKSILLIIFASMVGIETTSLIALLGAAGLAVGLALQGSLSNFAGGILILFFKPFKAGDVIEAQGYVGRVIEIQIFNTQLNTLDNQRVFIPNGVLSNGCVKNLFSEPTRRVDMTFGVSYSDDVLKVKEVIKGVLDAEPLILKEPVPDIFLSEHAASSINFLVRPWCNSEDFWPVYFGIHEAMKLAFDREGISIPFPQRDVHLIQASND